MAFFAWDESKHPRGQPENKGEFGPGGGGAAGEGRLWVTRKRAGEPSPADKAMAHNRRQRMYADPGNAHLEMREVGPAELAEFHKGGDAASGAALLALKVARANEPADQDAAVALDKNGTLTVIVGTERPVMSLFVKEGAGGRVVLDDGSRRKLVPAGDHAAQALWAHRLMGYRAPKALAGDAPGGRAAPFAAEAPLSFTPWAQGGAA